MKQSRGFTLIEVLVALTIFALLAVLSATALQHSLQIHRRLTQQAADWFQLQQTLIFLERDFQYTVRDHFEGDASHMTFTRAHTAPLGQQTPPFKQVTLTCRHQQLIRNTVLEDVTTTDVLLSNLSICHFAYLNSKKQRVKTWNNDLPLAVQVTVTTAAGSLQWLFPMLRA